MSASTTLRVIWTPEDVKSAQRLARLYDAVPLNSIGDVALAPVIDIRTRQVIA